MEAARDALDGAIAALFTSPQASTGDGTDRNECCLCGYPVEIPEEWRVLREFPVLARRIVTTWQRHAETIAPLAAPKKTRKSGSTTRSLHVRVFSVSRLCMHLYQCGILASDATMDDSEVVGMLASAMGPDVLPRVLENRFLSLRVRFRFFQNALASSTTTTCTAWVAGVCVALQQELRDNSAHSAATRPPSAATKSKKRGRESISRATKVLSSTPCERCMLASGSKTQLRLKANYRMMLVRELAKWIKKAHHGSGAGMDEAVTNLADVLNAPDVVQLLDKAVSEPSTDQRGRAPVGRIASRFGSNSASVRWELCDRIVESVCCDETKSYTSGTMWKIVWKRQNAKIAATQANGTGSLQDLVLVCATADQFTGPKWYNQVQAEKQDAISSLGYRVICEVMQDESLRSVSVVQFLRVVRDVVDRSSIGSSTLLSSSLRLVVIDYIRRFLQHEINAVVTSQVADGSPPPVSQKRTAKVKHEPSVSTTTQLLECLQLVHDVVRSDDLQRRTVENARRDGQRPALFELWYELVLWLSSKPTSSLSRPASSPLAWSSFLDTIAQCCEESKLLSAAVVRDFEDFVTALLVELVLSNGMRLGPSTSARRIAIPVQASSQSTLLVLLSLVLSSSSPRVVVEILCRIVAAATRTNVWRDTGGLRRLLLPSLAAFVTAAGFDNLVAGVYDRIKRYSLGYGHVRALVRFLYEWDSHCERTSCTLPSDNDSAGQQGMQIAAQLGMWQDLVHFYSAEPSNDRVQSETHAFLRYVVELLRSADATSCPTELEGSFFSVLSAINKTLQHTNDGRESTATITHSDAAVQRFLAVFNGYQSIHRCTDLLEGLRRDGKLEDLVLSLRRWLGIIASVPSSLPQATREELVLLANRLIHWCGDDDSQVETIRVQLTPVDPVLLSALRVYSGSTTTTTTAMAVGPPLSIVRLSLMMRSYFASTSVPDLIAFTSAIIDAALHSTTPSARDGVIKLLEGYIKSVVLEIVVQKLHDALLLGVEGDRSGSRTVENALGVIVSASVSSQQRYQRAIHLSCDLVSIATSERWLPVFLLAGLVSEDASTTTTAVAQAEAFLACVERLLDHHQERENENTEDEWCPFKNAYALVALFSTIELALKTTAVATPLVVRLEAVHRKLRAYLNSTIESTIPAESNNVLENCLLCTVGTYQRPQVRKRGATKPSRKAATAFHYTSGLVHIQSHSATGVVSSSSGGTDGEWLRPVERAPEETMMLIAHEAMDSVRYFLPFASWLRSAFCKPLHHQQQLQQGRWESVFVDIVLQFYLPMQFHGDSAALTATWLRVWTEQSLMAPGSRCIDLQPFQRQQLLQLVASSSPWRHIVQCARDLLSLTPSTSSVSRNSMMAHIVDSLDLMALCAMQQIDWETHRAMANDIVSVLQQVQALQEMMNFTPHKPTGVQSLQFVAPLLEIFVRACLQVTRSTFSPSDRGDCIEHIEDAVVQVASLLQLVLLETAHATRADKDKEIGRAYWHSLLSQWKRTYSHLNPRDSRAVFAAFEIAL